LSIIKENNNINNSNNNINNNNFNINNINNNNLNIDEYEFINILLKNICDNDDINNKNNNNNNNDNIVLENFKNFIGDISKNDNLILNLSILGDKNTQNIYQQRENYYREILENKTDIQNIQQIFLCFLFIYNKICLIYNSNNNNKILEIRKLSKLIIDYSNNFVKSNLYLNNLFQNYIYFKDLFNKIYFIYLYSFFLEGNLNEALNEFNTFNDLIQFQYELKINQKSYFNIMKLKGDILFKMGKFKEAIESYSNLNSDFKSNEIDFNLGLCYLFENNKKKGLNLLEKTKENYLQNNNNKDQDKITIINEIINKIN
jgi:hypothetical protein